MIHILVGDDSKSKSLYIKDLIKGKEFFFLSGSDLNKDLIVNYSDNRSLFGESPLIIVDNILNEESIVFSSKEIESLMESKTIFVFKEDKLSSPLQKKYKKFGEIKIFELKKTSQIQKFNVFGITDAYSNKDKITTWILYRNGINSNIEPEAIAGVIFWKIKTMILNGSRVFSKDELKKQSSSLVSLYHKAHKGESDFTVSLEQFILSSLSSR